MSVVFAAEREDEAMKTEDLRNYGAAFSEAEGAWPEEVKRRMRRRGRSIVMSHLGLWQKLVFFFYFVGAKIRAWRLDLTDLREQGMTDEAFLAQQLEYLATFSALAEVVESERAVEIMKKVMDETAREPLMLCLPKADNVRAIDEDNLSIFRDFIGEMAQASGCAGCNEMNVEDESPDAFQMNVTWCVWLELAQRMDVPEGCRPNCYADDLVFPEYFDELGIEYSRSQTLARGGNCCDFRFERTAGDQESSGGKQQG